MPWLRRSIAGLVANGCEVRVLAPAYKGLKSHTIDGTPVLRFRYAPAKLEILTHDEGAPSKMAGRPWLQLLAIPYIISGFLKCFSSCLKWRPHLIHAHWPFPHAIIALGAAKVFRIPLVLNFHGAELLLIRKHAWIKPVLKFLIGQADAIFANSSFTAGKIKALRASEVFISPYGTTLAKGKSEELHARRGRFKILFVGRHIERKGLTYLIRAAALLSKEEFEVRIVGAGDLTEKLKAEAAELAPEIVVFTGKLSPEELAAEYQSANAFTLPAIVDSKGDTEGLGVVLIEAAEANLPIVASNVGGIPDVVLDGVTGLLVPEKNPKALAEAFKRLASDEELMARLNRNAHEHIRKNFSWEPILKKQLELYRSLMK